MPGALIDADNDDALADLIKSANDGPQKIAAAGAAVFGTMLGGPLAGASAHTASIAFGSWLAKNDATQRLLTAAREQKDMKAKKDAEQAVIKLVADSVSAAKARSFDSGLIEEGFEQALLGISTVIARLSSLDQHMVDANSKLDELLRAVSVEKGVPIALLQTILKRLGELDVPEQEIAARLSSKADELLSLRIALQKATLPELLGDVRAQALALLERGELDEASALLRSAREKLREHRQEHARTEAVFLTDEAKIDRLGLRYRVCAEKYAEAAELVRFDQDESGRYATAQAQALYDLGHELADNAALAEAIAIYRDALSVRTRDRVPLDWAQTQNDLGTALHVLGQRLGDRRLLEEAERAYRAALQERPPDRTLEWAQTQSNLAGLIALLSKFPGDVDRLLEAVELFKSVLRHYARDEHPLHWAHAQNNLGTALMELGRSENRPDSLTEAVLAHRSALEVFTRESGPLNWASTMHNLANALLACGQSLNDAVSLTEAVDAYRLALEGHTRARRPLHWAHTQNALGLALCSLSGADTGTNHLTHAVEAFCAALKERTRERSPHAWAQTQRNLGDALHALAAREANATLLGEAQAAYAAALEVLTRDDNLFTWADVQSRLALVVWALGAEAEPRGALQHEAARSMRAVQDAIQGVLPHQHPLLMTIAYHAWTMNLELAEPG